MSPSTAVYLLLFGSTVISAQSCTLTDFKQSSIFNDDFDINNLKETHAAGEIVTVHCRHGFRGNFTMVCINGLWFHRGDKCRAVTCKLSQKPPVGTRYDPLNQNIFLPGQTVIASCGAKQWVKSRDLQSADLTCQPSGQWDFDPVCQWVKCSKIADHVTRWGGFWFGFNTINIDEGVWYDCDPAYMKTSYSATCTRAGWEPNPLCKEVTCELPASSTRVNIVGADGDRVTVGNRITVQCVARGSSKELECLSSGQWSSAFPTCTDTCDVADVPDSVLASRKVRQLQRGQTLKFRCKNSTHTLHGAASITCLEDGQWSQPFPSCSGSQRCGSPPSLENGDYLSTNTQFEHNEEVEYLCQTKYVMQGGPHKTCVNGVWTGEITCLKPCVLTPERMRPNKIKFRRINTDKLYAPHNDFLTFQCIEGATHDGVVALKQKCNDGAIDLPRCV